MNDDLKELEEMERIENNIMLDAWRAVYDAYMDERKANVTGYLCCILSELEREDKITQEQHDRCYKEIEQEANALGADIEGGLWADDEDRKKFVISRIRNYGGDEKL